jgi:hypothetical protein
LGIVAADLLTGSLKSQPASQTAQNHRRCRRAQRQRTRRRCRRAQRQRTRRRCS